jgi:hypothetical protein
VALSFFSFLLRLTIAVYPLLPSSTSSASLIFGISPAAIIYSLFFSAIAFYSSYDLVNH